MNAISQLVSELKATVLYQDKTYSLEVISRSNGFEYCLVGIKSGSCNWIIRYDSGKIAYDNYVANTTHNKVLKAITKHFNSVN